MKSTALLDRFLDGNQSFEKHWSLSKIYNVIFLKSPNILNNSGKRITAVFGTRVLMNFD